MRFVLTINLGNDAMQTQRDISEALRALASRLVRNETRYPVDGDGGSITDDNGNRVGAWHVESER